MSELHDFLAGLRPGELLSGTVASIERFGVFVALDDGPEHPTLPGVGFISVPELSWRRFDDAADVVSVGQRVTCEFLQFDTWNAEARLSLRATQPDPLHAFAAGLVPERQMCGRVTKVVPFGVFVEVADGIEGLLHRDLAPGPFEVGDEVTVVVTEVDRARRRVVLSPSGPA